MEKNNQGPKLLEVKNLNKIFVTGNSRVHAVNDVSFELAKGETIGLIGESGSGKTTIGRTIIRLNDPTSGQIILKGANIGQKKLSKDSKKLLRTNIQMIFQDPYSSLNEQMNIMNIIAEPIKTQKLDKKYLVDFSEDYDKMIEFYKYFMIEKINKLRWDNALKNREFALSEFTKEINRLKSFEITASSKWEEIEALTTLYFGVKIDGNATITNNSLSVSEEILNLWKETKKELKDGKVFTENEQRYKKAKEQFKKYTDLSKHVKEYFKYKEEYKTLKKYNKVFTSYVRDEVKVFTGTVKSLSGIIRDQAIDSSIKAKTSKTISDFNFSTMESKVKFMIAKALKIKTGDNYSTEIIEKVEKFERSSMITLLKVQSEAKIESKVITDGLVVDVDGHKVELTEKWDKLLKSVLVTEKDIIKEFISNSKLLLNDFTKKEKDYLNTLPFDSVEKMLIEEKTLKAKVEEFKNVKPNPKYLESLKLAEQELNECKEINDKLKNEWLVSYEAKQEKAKKEFEREFKVVSEKVEKVVQKTKDLYIAKKEMIIASNLPWFKDKEFKNPEKVFDKKKKALQKHLSGINLSLEDETKRILKDNDMLRDAIVGEKFNKRKIKEYLVREKVFSVLEEAGLTKAHAFRYPHEFSGGMRQRVGIARAIVSQPDIIVADEPIAALDLSIQAQIANLLKSMQEKRDMSMIFIAHDLSMVKHISDKILIIHLGRIVESGSTKEIFENPVHPYTKNLIKSMPDISRISAGFENNNFEGKYLEGYTVINQPEYFEVKGTHKVLATKEQFKIWTK